MWMVMVTKCTGGYLFIVLNSFIHSIMYFYYAMSSINIKLPGKKMITILQMTQFMVGNSIAIIQIYNYSYCMTKTDIFTIVYHIIYTSILFVMFRVFYKKSYKKN